MGDGITDDAAAQGADLTVRPQGLLLSLCGHFLLDEPGLLLTGSFVEALTRAGVGEHAARTTLTRMTQRGFFERHRIGAKVYLSMTASAEQMLRDAGERLWLQGAVNASWTGEWTLLSFSLPESRRAERHQLRRRLTWEGFAMLHSGLWITPSPVNVPTLLSGLDVENEIKVFRGGALPPTDVQQLVRDAWDLDALAAGYASFLARWSDPDHRAEGEDALGRVLVLLTEWLLLVRIDPHLPVELLPPEWPAAPAQRLVMQLRQRYEPEARRVFDDFAERLPARRAG